MSKYEKLDAAMITAIKAGANTMNLLEQSKRVVALAEPLREKQRWGYTPTFRIIDRRLQALRKRGEIAYQGKCWGVVAEREA